MAELQSLPRGQPLWAGGGMDMELTAEHKVLKVKQVT